MRLAGVPAMREGFFMGKTRLLASLFLIFSLTLFALPVAPVALAVGPDVTPPTTTITRSGSANLAAWDKTPVTLTFSATDDQQLVSITYSATADPTAGGQTVAPQDIFNP